MRRSKSTEEFKRCTLYFRFVNHHDGKGILRVMALGPTELPHIRWKYWFFILGIEDSLAGLREQLRPETYGVGVPRHH